MATGRTDEHEPMRDVHARRLSAQLLVEPVATTLDVVERITAVQAQDPRGFRLAVRARSTVPSYAGVDTALTDDRSVVVDWLNRGTLHLVRAEDHAWLHALTTPQLRTSSRRRLEQLGVAPDQVERGVELVRACLREEGPLTRAQLRDRLDAAGIPTAGQALVHLLFAASLDGQCLRGPVVGTEQAFVHPEDWLGPRPEVDRDVALGELARRYLVGHGPASDRDLAKWANIPLGDARSGLRRMGSSLVDRADGLVDVERLGDDAAVASLPAPRLLGPYDPVLHGWVDRSPVVGEHGQGIVTNNGLFRACALVGGRAVATWRYAGGTVELEPLPGVRIPATARRALDADAVAVHRWLT